MQRKQAELEEAAPALQARKFGSAREVGHVIEIVVVIAREVLSEKGSW